jgi:glutamate dehydrogenase (NAD(P)+)
VAVSDRTGGVHNPAGLDVDAAVEYVRRHKTLEGYMGGDRVSNEELLELEVDVLVPAALENVITSKNAGRIRARIIAEGRMAPRPPAPTRSWRRRGSSSSPTSSPTRAA